MQIDSTQYKYISYNTNGVFTIPSGRTPFLVFEIYRAHNINILCTTYQFECTAWYPVSTTYYLGCTPQLINIYISDNTRAKVKCISNVVFFHLIRLIK